MTLKGRGRCSAGDRRVVERGRSDSRNLEWLIWFAVAFVGLVSVFLSAAFAFMEIISTIAACFAMHCEEAVAAGAASTLLGLGILALAVGLIGLLMPNRGA